MKISFYDALQHVARQQGKEVRPKWSYRRDLGGSEILVLGVEVEPYQDMTEPTYRLEIFVDGKHTSGAIV